MTALLKIVLTVVWFVIALSPSMTIAYIALSHNPQNEYIDAIGRVEWGSLAPVVLPPLIVGVPLATFIVAILVLVVNQIKNRSRE